MINSKRFYHFHIRGSTNIGIYLMKTEVWVARYPQKGSLGKNVIGGLIFGVGFAVLGCCPGTIAGAIGNGYPDALVGGLIGIWIGSGLFAALYPQLNRIILDKGDFWGMTLPRPFKVNDWVVVISVSALIVILLVMIENAGL